MSDLSEYIPWRIQSDSGGKPRIETSLSSPCSSWVSKWYWCLGKPAELLPRMLNVPHPAKSFGPPTNALPPAPTSVKYAYAGMSVVETVLPSESMIAMGSGELKPSTSEPMKLYRSTLIGLCRQPGLAATAFSVVVLVIRPGAVAIEAARVGRR